MATLWEPWLMQGEEAQQNFLWMLRTVYAHVCAPLHACMCVHMCVYVGAHMSRGALLGEGGPKECAIDTAEGGKICTH